MRAEPTAGPLSAATRIPECVKNVRVRGEEEKTDAEK